MQGALNAKSILKVLITSGTIHGKAVVFKSIFADPTFIHLRPSAE